MKILQKCTVLSVVFSGIAFLNVACNFGQVKEHKSPNFLFILVDDQPFDAFSYHGRYSFLNTPNIDRIATEGAWFENAYCTASLCSPSRASFLTGTYPHIHGVTQNHPKVDPDWSSYPPYTSVLQKGGYETAMIGKIHMAHVDGEEHVRPGFDYWLSFKGQGEYFNPMLNLNGQEFRQEGYMTDILTDYALEWLSSGRDKHKPFSLCVWHKAVHEPYEAAPRHKNSFSEAKLPLPPGGSAHETFFGKPEWQRIKALDSKWESYIPVDSFPEKPWDESNTRYLNLLECILAIDESTGKLLDFLEQTGELDNTVIIYSSDNGYFMGEHGYWDKRIAYEPSMKIPLLIRYPGLIKEKSRISQLSMNIDIAPTILDLAGLTVPSYMQGKSLVNLFSLENDLEWRNSILFEYYVDDAYPYAGPDMIAVRKGKYKLVDSFLDNDIDELYDLEEDPGEMSNLINDISYDIIETELRVEAKQLIEKYSYNHDRDWWLRQVLGKE